MLGEKYVLDRMIGKGGMGVVWAGTNQRTGKRVALKVIRRSFASNSQAAELFRREALAASRVNHPNVVSVFDVVDIEGMSCIVMELLDGEPLNEYMARKGPLSMEEAAALLLPAMRGVSAANTQGVVHRDLKPHNIFVCMGPDGRPVTTKVLDFGSSVMMEKALGSSSATVEIANLGTPAYMSPEHIAGVPHIDERADVYGFGVVFFEALAGQHPFPGSPGPSLLMRILHEQPLSLSSLRPDLSAEAVHIIERAMAKEPGERFPNLDPFIRLIEDHLLPSTPLPRSMTPLAGVPAFPLGHASSGVGNTVVQVARRPEGSGLHETQALYNLQGAITPGVGETPVRRLILNRTDESAPDLTDAVEELPPAAGAVRQFFARPVVVGIIFSAVLALVIWVAFPMPKSPQKGPVSRPAPPSQAVRAPTVHVPAPAPVETAQPAPEPSPPANPEDSVTEDMPPDEIDPAAWALTHATTPTTKAGRGLRHASARAAFRSAHGQEEPYVSTSSAPVSPADPTPSSSAPSEPSSVPARPPSPPPASAADQPSPVPQPPPAAVRPPKRAGDLSPDDF